MTNRTFPVLGTSLVIPWEVAHQAQHCLAMRLMGASTPMSRRLGHGWLTLKDRKQMGGFTEEELDRWAPDWREHAREVDNDQ